MEDIIKIHPSILFELSVFTQDCWSFCCNRHTINKTLKGCDIVVDTEYVAHLEELLLETTTQLIAIKECLAYMEIDPYY